LLTVFGTAQEALKAGTQEPSIFDQHRYRWLTHASKICNRRQRGRSDASVVPVLDLWALEFHKRHGRLLRQQVGGANGVVNPIVLPLHRPQVSGKFRGLERGTHAVHERHSFKDTIDDASGDTKSGNRGDVVGHRSSAACKISKTDVEGLARHSEAARATERRRESSSADGPRQRAASSPFGLRELQTRDRRSADAVCVSRNQRGHRKTTSGEDGGGSRGFSVDGSTYDFQIDLTGEVFGACCAQQDRACRKDAYEIRGASGSVYARESTSRSNIAVLSVVGIAGVFCSGTRSGRACPNTKSDESRYNNPNEGARAECSKDRASERRSRKQGSTRSDNQEPTICRFQQRCNIRSEYASTSDTIKSSFRPAVAIPRDHVERDGGDILDGLTCRGHAESCSAQTEDSSPLASLDGPSEAQKVSAVERRVSQVPSGQVAARIRVLELMNAVPMPRHFQPAGQTRHAKVHHQHPHVDDEPAVELIFPLHVRQFPRRTSTGSPCRPESPIHRSIPQGEPHIHSPQPARSMPMLRDPPEAEPQSETRPLGISQNNQESPAMASGSVRRASDNSLTRRRSPS